MSAFEADRFNHSRTSPHEKAVNRRKNHDSSLRSE
jgi:hypothetical protein